MPDELILLVDDEPAILKLGRLYLEREGFRVEEARDGEAALREIENRRPALVVLDLMLPKVDGFEVCRRLRDAGRDVAILMLTARDDDIDKIVGLELGADDYLTKPFNPRELVARTKAILRRGSRKPAVDEKPIRFWGLEIDPVRREVSVDSHRVALRTQEFDLLAVLASQPGRVFTREQLLQQAWGFDFYGQTRTVDVHVAHLRKKLSGGSVGIETITGVGYKLTAETDYVT
jgi:DNA-binding response OmpR family regulator